MRVIWSEPALDDIDLAYDYLRDFNLRAARRVVEALHAAAAGLEHFPRRGRPVLGTNMRELITSYSYILRYRIADDTVIILRVRHTSRRPTTP